MVKHVLADGREVDSIEGFVIPTTGETAAVYHIVAEHAANQKERTQQIKGENTNATA